MTPGPSLRIVQVSPYSWDVPGGVQVHVRELASHLRALGHEVHILAPGRPREHDDGVTIVGRAIPVRGNGSVARIAFGPQVARAAAQALKRIQPDIIHVHEPLVPSVSMHAVLNANAPVVATFHSNVGRDRTSSLWFQLAVPMIRPVWNRIDRRLAVSEAARHSVCSRMGDGNLTIVPNGVDTGRFANAVAAPLPPGRHLLFVGRLEERKGFPVAVQAFAELASRFPDLRLLVIGDGSERDAVDALEPAVRDRVDMLGRVDDDRLASYLKAADIYIGPALGGESFGIVLAEAMAAGRPVVASDIDGYRDVVRDGLEALLVRPGDPAALVAGIQELLADRRLAESLGSAGAQRAREFDWDVISARVLEIYREVLAAPHPAATGAAPATP
ncbi:MAG TPA: glycosyltransferase family 4 protein [Gemmatimonadaceae bacterium]